jgi:antitoxin VapB
MIATAKIFKTGRSQAVRLPKRFRFDADEVHIQATPDGLLLTEKSAWELFYEGIQELDGAFTSEREQPPYDKRDIAAKFARHWKKPVCPSAPWTS